MRIDLNNLGSVPQPIAELFDAAAESGELPNYGKPNCYKCQHRSRVPGSAHSTCSWFTGKTKMALAAGVMTYGGNGVTGVKIAGNEIPIVGLHQFGLHGGWAMWPVDFDPRWVLWCIGYDPVSGDSNAD